MKFGIPDMRCVKMYNIIAFYEVLMAWPFGRTDGIAHINISNRKINVHILKMNNITSG